MSGKGAGGAEAFETLRTLDVVAMLSELTTPVMVLDTALKFVFANDAYLRGTDRTLEAIAGQHVFSVFPDIPERVKAVERKFRRALSGTPTVLRAQPYILHKSDGSEETRYWRATQEPLRDRNGEVAFMIQRAEDVTEAVVARRERALIARELDHRTKNVLTVVQAMTRMASREYETKEEFADDILGRIGAMSRNHARLYQNDFEGMTVRNLVRDELAAITSKAAFSLSGRDDVRVDARLARDLSMVVHELATNAAKYGSLSVEGGHLAVTWAALDGALVIDWRESGCGPVGDLGEHGFGTKLMRMVRNIDVEREGTDDGLHARLVCRGVLAPEAPA